MMFLGRKRKTLSGEGLVLLFFMIFVRPPGCPPWIYTGWITHLAGGLTSQCRLKTDRSGATAMLQMTSSPDKVLLFMAKYLISDP